MEDRRKVVIKALNRPQLIAGVEMKIFGLVCLLCLVLFTVVSKLAAFLLLFLMVFCGHRVTKVDLQLPILWFASLRQGGSYDPFKYNDAEDKGHLVVRESELI
jgi:Type IV secretory pathway, VirB3 components